MRGIARATLLAAATALTLPAGAAAASHRYVGEFGGAGLGAGLFGPPRADSPTYRLRKSPTGIALDRDGTLWVSNPGEGADAPGRVRIDHFTGDGRYLGGFGRYAIRPKGLHRPEGLVIGRRGELDVVSNGNDRVDRFSRRGRFLGAFHVLSRLSLWFGKTRGAGRGELHNPYGIARSAAGTVYVADLNNGRVNRYDARGRSRGQIGSFGTAPGQLLAPFGVAVDPAGNVWVSDRELNRVQEFSPAGQLLRAIGNTGDRGGEFLSPQGLAADRLGRIYVADTVNARIQVFSPGGDLLETFGEGRLTEPDYITVDGNCRVWVTDYRRVVRFADPNGCA